MQYVQGLIVPHFSYRSCACRHCGELLIISLLHRHMERLEGLRVDMGFPIVITSGHRCVMHNRREGGKEKSMHLTFATDIRPLDRDREKLIRMRDYITEQELFDGVGVYGSFLHVDLRGYRARWTGT